MPALARFQRDRSDPGWYVLCRPDGRGEIDDRGEVGVGTGAAGLIAPLVWLVVVVLGGTVAAALGGGGMVAVLGLVVGALVGIPLAAYLVRAARARRDRGGPVSLRVEPDDERAWRLCRLAGEIAEVGVWRDRTVDPQRRLPAIVWAAVGRALDADARCADARRALGHDNLRELAEQTIAQVERERAAVDAVEANLAEVRAAALAIDGRRSAGTRAAERAAEERELRERLTGPELLAGPTAAETQADRSAGLAAEAEAVADLLADSDRMLHGTG